MPVCICVLPHWPTGLCPFPGRAVPCRRLASVLLQVPAARELLHEHKQWVPLLEALAAATQRQAEALVQQGHGQGQAAGTAAAIAGGCTITCGRRQRTQMPRRARSALYFL